MESVRSLLGLNASKDTDAIIERLMLSLPTTGRPRGYYDDERYSLDPRQGRPTPYNALKEYRAQQLAERGDTRGGLAASYGTLLEPAVPKVSAAKERLQKGQRFRARSKGENVLPKQVAEIEGQTVQLPTVPTVVELSDGCSSADEIQRSSKPQNLDPTPKTEPDLKSTTFFCGPPSNCSEDISTAAVTHRRTKSKIKTRPEVPPSPPLEHKSSSDTDPATTPDIIVPLTSPAHRDLFLRMFGVLFTARMTTSFTDFVAAMVDAGFTAQHSAGGSAVTFKDHKHRYGGGSIHFHRPHPDPRIEYPKLRTWGKRLGMKFGWGEGSFVVR